MLLVLIKILGWLAAHAPECLMRWLAHGLGDLMYGLFKKRRYMGTQNLSHAFPERPPSWHRRMCRQSCRRLGETALLSLAAPFLSEKRIRRIARAPAQTTGWVGSYWEAPRPIVFGTAHFAYWETQTWLGLFLEPKPMPPFGVVFRPLDNAALNDYMLKTRSRFGIRLLSRKEGFSEAQHILHERGCVALLFDQNAGGKGALTTLCGRICSATELPGLLVAKHQAELRVFYPYRLGFWRVEFRCEVLAHDGTIAGVTIALNRWLERVLSEDENLCASWLWTHDRWKVQVDPNKRFRLEAKRDLLQEDLAARGWSSLPKRLRVWLRLPEHPQQVGQVAGLVAAIVAGRPDAEVTVVGEPGLVEPAQSWPGVHQVVVLPARGTARTGYFRSLVDSYIDVFLVLAETPEADREAVLSGAKQRFGLVRPGQARPLLSHWYEVPKEPASPTPDILDLWEAMLRRFGLQVPVVRPPARD